MKRLGLTIFFALCSFTPAHSQTAATGALAGNVIDASGAGVPDTKIAVTNEATGEVRQLLSQANGSYVVPLLPPGVYRVEFAHAGFKSSVKPGLTINVTETSRLDVPLEVGSLQVVMLNPATMKELLRLRIDKPIDIAPDQMVATVNSVVTELFAKYPTRVPKK